ncbi:hypothetical protein CTI12_AA148950 [Artemisia annua]|uniref:Uncharacterized protein n=1 Tax=Artemisia annua TaxID=35608 RepID=A0A2U1PHF5_ARTAN|nr:hypothetical protein CTI12_AA148950 [Artemisia annua]
MNHVESMRLFVSLVRQQRSARKPLRLFCLHVGVNQIRQQSVAALIVGLPSNSGQKHPGKDPNATEVEVFVDELSKTGKLEGVKYTLWEDSCTALNGVECLLDPLPLDPPAARKLRSKVSVTCATEMLQHYLDTVRRVVPRNI